MPNGHPALAIDVSLLSGNLSGDIAGRPSEIIKAMAVDWEE
jgi:hypothetical protein